MDTKKYIIGAGLAATLMLSAFSLVSADLMGGQVNTVVLPAIQKIVLEVNPNGKVLLRGTVSAVASGSLTVKSWGGDWVINTSATTKFMPEGSAISQVGVGDLVGVQGMVNQNASLTVDATLVRDWSMREIVKNNKEEVKDIIKAGTPRNWEGVASNVNNDTNTLTLTVGGVAYNVTLTANVKIVNQKFMTLGFASVKNGDTVRVWGPLSGTTITASVVRDVSVQ